MYPPSPVRLGFNPENYPQKMVFWQKKLKILVFAPKMLKNKQKTRKNPKNREKVAI